MFVLCTCGRRVGSETDWESHGALLFLESRYEEAWVVLQHQLSALVVARSGGDLGRWVARVMGDEYPFDGSEEAVGALVADLLTSMQVAEGLRVYQCVDCGRLWIRDSRPDGTVRFHCFSPDEEDPSFRID